jgi:hypothetical protein
MANKKLKSVRVLVALILAAVLCLTALRMSHGTYVNQLSEWNEGVVVEFASLRHLWPGRLTALEVRSCNAQLDQLANASKIIEIEEMGDDLRVLVSSPTSCAGTTLSSPRYRLDDNTITLDWAWKREKVSTSCKCMRRVEFIVPDGAEIDDPDVHIEQ